VSEQTGRERRKPDWRELISAMVGAAVFAALEFLSKWIGR
jgi:hypothetical protein